jgi:hypothetical protein
MMNKILSTALAVASLYSVGALSAHAADTAGQAYEETDAVDGVKIGYLSCNVGSGGGYLLGSAKEVDCTFNSTNSADRPDHYTGVVKKFGIDLGYTAQGKLLWAVFAPTAGYHHGSLGGVYVGAAAEATLGGGLGANVLVGGTKGSIQLQTISVTGQIGLNVSAAGASMTLKSVR